MANRTYEEVLKFVIKAGGDEELVALVREMANLGEAGEEAEGKVAGLLEELGNAKGLERTAAAFKEQGREVLETSRRYEEAKAKVAQLAQEMSELEKPTAKQEAAFRRARQDLQRVGAQITESRARWAELRGELERNGIAARSYSQIQAEVASRQQAAAAAVKGYARDQIEARNAAAQTAQRIAEGDEAFRKQAAASRAAAEALQAYRQRMAEAAKAQAEAAAGMGRFSRESAAAQGALGQLGGIAGRLTGIAAGTAAALSAVAAAGGGALFTGAIGSAKTLEEALSQVRAVSGATAAEMASLKAAAESGAAATKFSTLEAAQGLGELARATGSAKTAIEALPATLNLAQAAGIGVAEAAQIITTTLTQFGLSATEAARVADVLAKAANSTTADIAGLGNGLSYVAPLARQLGLDAEQTVAVLGALADQGFRGERAGTALRSVLSELLDPTSDFSRALRDMGVETTNFAEIVTLLSRRADGGREALLKLDAEARPAIQALVNGGVKQLGTLETSLRSAGGSAAETARVMGDNLAGAAERIGDTFDRTRRSLVEPLLEPLGDEINKLAADLEAFARSDDFAALRDALVVLFREGATAARELFEEVDFPALAEDIRAFATDSDGSLTNFKDTLRTVGDAIILIGQTSSTVFNALQTVIFGASSAVTGAVAGIAQAMDNLSAPMVKLLQFLGVIEEGPRALEEFAGGMQAISDDFALRTTKNFDETVAAAKRMGDGLADAGDKASAGATKAAEASDKSAAASKRSAEASNEAAAAHAKHGAAATSAATATARSAAQMSADAERLKKAFADLGIQSQADLTRTADAARRNFEIVQRAAASGAASAEDVRRAFLAYAQSATAAVSASDASAQQRVQAELGVQAAVIGVTGALNDQADAALRAAAAMNGKGGQGGSGPAGNYALIRNEVVNTAEATDSLAKSVDWLSSKTDKAGESSQKAAGDVKGFGLVLGSVSMEFTKAALAANKFVNSIDNSTWRNSLNRLTAEYEEQFASVRREMEALRAEMAKDDPVAQRVEELKSRFRYLGEDQLRELAELEAQVAEHKRQQAEAAERTRDAEMARYRDAPVDGDAPQATASITRRANESAAATARVLDQAERAAAAMGTAAARMTSAAPASEIVIRIVSDAPAGAMPLKLTSSDIKTLTAAILRELNWQRSLTR